MERICASPGFAHSERMVRFLRWVVGKTLDGEMSVIREYSIGLEVFDRDPSYDPKIDTIVRVEARRLRKKLDDYYSDTGQDDVVRIEIPGPGYVPRFSVNGAGPRALLNHDFTEDRMEGESEGDWKERLRRWLNKP